MLSLKKLFAVRYLLLPWGQLFKEMAPNNNNNKAISLLGALPEGTGGFFTRGSVVILDYAFKI